MSASERKPHTEEGILRFEALEEFIRRKVRRNPPKKSNLAGSMTLRVLARPNGDRKQKAKQYEIAVAASLGQLEVAATPQEVEECAITETASVLFELKRRGAVFSGELGDLLNNCDNEGVACEISHDTWQALEKMTGKTGDELRERVFQVLKRRYWDDIEEIRLPRIAEELLPKEPDTTQGVDDIPF